MVNIINDARSAEWETHVFPRLKCAWQKLKLEKELFISAVGERSLTHRFAVHLDPLFMGWNVDCEYNRIGSSGKTKKIRTLINTMSDEKPESTEAIKIYPDVSIHRRGDTSVDGNLLVIEVKKSSNETDSAWDLEKLEAYVNPKEKQEFVYRFGLFLRIDVNNRAISESKLYENRIGVHSEFLNNWD